MTSCRFCAVGGWGTIPPMSCRATGAWKFPLPAVIGGLASAIVCVLALSGVAWADQGLDAPAQDIRDTVLVLDLEFSGNRIPATTREAWSDGLREAVLSAVSGRLGVLTSESLENLLPPEQYECRTSTCFLELGRVLLERGHRTAWIVGGQVREEGSSLTVRIDTYDTRSATLAATVRYQATRPDLVGRWVMEDLRTDLQCDLQGWSRLRILSRVCGLAIRMQGPDGALGAGGEPMVVPWGPSCVPPGDYVVEVSASGYRAEPVSISLRSHERREVDLIVEPVPVAGVGPMDGYVLLPPGVFRRGAGTDETGATPEEGPAHEVLLTRPFFVQAHEVTRREWRERMGTEPGHFPACGDDCPVEGITWWEALAYCNALSAAHGFEECYRFSGCNERKPGDGMVCRHAEFSGTGCTGFRLPTEAEWEYAARAGTTTSTPAGNLRVVGAFDAPVLADIAWYGGNSRVEWNGGVDCDNWKDRAVPAVQCGPQPVGRKRPNAWGLHDMLGNVWEWCWDRMSRYGRDALVDPAGPSQGRADRVERGGAWDSEPFQVRSASRIADDPGRGSFSVGFRPVRTSPDGDRLACPR